MWISFSVSPSSSRVTGMPVQRATMDAISSVSTSSLRSAPSVCSDFNLRFRRLDVFFNVTQVTIPQAGGFFEIRFALGAFDIQVRLFSLSFSSRSSAMACFSVCQRADNALDDLAQVSQFLFDLRKAFLRSLVLFLLQGFTLDLQLHDLTIDTSSSCGLESISVRRRAAASSIRSMALSGS
jgi:hypothetical protein